jgi:hypothetical protein
VRGDGTRIAIATAVPVSEGTRTWVLAAEIDADHLLDGFTDATQEGAVALVTHESIIGRSNRIPEDALRAIAARARAHPREPEMVATREWRAVVARAPAGLDGVLAIVWTGEAEVTRRLRFGELALGVIVMSIVGALAAGLAVALREAPAAAEPSRDAREAQALGAVVKELANPIAANTAAAQLLGNETGKSRLVETVQRSAMRVERIFRRVARLARSGEESSLGAVDLASVVRRETEAARSDLEQAGHALQIDIDVGDATVKADADDMALLVQVLIDAAGAVSPPQGAVRIALSTERDPAGYALRVCDRGATPARDRRALTDLAEGTRSEGAAPVLAWALAARIARDHRAELQFHERDEGWTEAVVRFERA